MATTTVSVHDAQEHLPSLLDRVANGEEVIIERGGASPVKLTLLQPPKRRLGLLDGMWDVPDDFDTMFQKEIEEMFYGESAK